MKGGIKIPRLPRNIISSKFYHAMSQGIERKNIFDDEISINKYIELMFINKDRANVEILAYCVMKNHVHILIYSKKVDNIIKFFRYTNTAYAKYFNNVNDRVGYVFRDRYKTQNIYTIKQLVNTINYIHNNPVKAGICDFPSDYEYSSYSEYESKTRIVNKKILNKLFGQKEFNLYFLNKKRF